MRRPTPPHPCASTARPHPRSRRLALCRHGWPPARTQTFERVPNFPDRRRVGTRRVALGRADARATERRGVLGFRPGVVDRPVALPAALGPRIVGRLRSLRGAGQRRGAAGREDEDHRRAEYSCAHAFALTQGWCQRRWLGIPPRGAGPGSAISGTRQRATA